MKKLFITLISIGIVNFVFGQSDTIKTNKDIIYKQFYYPNGKISSEGYLKDNKPTGYWKSYYMTGVLKSEGKWSNSKLDSVWIFYDQLGDTLEKINYYVGNKSGYHYRYFKDDKYKNRIYSKELYLNGKRNDKSYFYFGDGSIKMIIPYVNDKKQGNGFEYDEKGKIISVLRFRNNNLIEKEEINRMDEDGKKNGIWKEFYKNDILKEEKTYLNGKLDGYVKLYNEEGKLISAIKYENGEVNLQGKDIDIDVEIKEEYDKNDNLIFQGSYKKDIPIGVHRYFDKRGNVVSSKTYDINGNLIADGIVLINGKEQGDWKYYYENGNKKAVGTYNNGKKSGKWSYYYKNGRIQQIGSYSAGRLTGIWQWYYETGELLKEEYYIYGKLDGEAIEYSELGSIISKGNYVEGYKEGDWVYTIGDQRYIGNYVMDLKDGVWKSYYLEENKLSFEGKYVQGSPDGKHEYFYPNGNIKEERYYSEGEKIRSWSKYDEQGNLIIVVQYREGNPYKINGVKVNLGEGEN